MSGSVHSVTLNRAPTSVSRRTTPCWGVGGEVFDGGSHPTDFHQMPLDSVTWYFQMPISEFEDVRRSRNNPVSITVQCACALLQQIPNGPAAACRVFAVEGSLQ